MSISQALLDAAEYHNGLVCRLERLGDVPQQLEQQNQLIKSLNTSLGKSEAKVKKFHAETGKQRKEHQEIQASVTKKLVYTLTGRKSKFLALAGKEEREYVEALQQEVRERKGVEEIELVLSEALVKQATLLEQVETYHALHAELDELHSNIFDGPTSGLPRDDQLEAQMAFAKSSVDSIQVQLDSGSLTCVLFDDVIERLDKAVEEIVLALRSGGNGREGCAKRARNLLREAKKICKDLPPLQNNTSPAMLVDVYDSGGLYHRDELLAFDRQLKQSKDRVKEQLEYTKRFMKVLETDLKEANDVLDESRVALREFRMSVFQNPTKFQEPSRPAQEPGPPIATFTSPSEAQFMTQSSPPTVDRAATPDLLAMLAPPEYSAI